MEAASGIKEKVMGTADDLTSSGGSAVSSVTNAPGAMTQKARRRTEGNPSPRV